MSVDILGDSASTRSQRRRNLKGEGYIPTVLEVAFGWQGVRPMSADYYLMRRAPSANNAAAAKTKGIYYFFIGLLGYWLIALPVYAAVERVISLAPSTTELAYAAGLGEKLIAASDFSDYPAAANKLERVASWQGINVERILALKPDLILAWRGGNPQRPLDQLAALGIPILF